MWSNSPIAAAVRLTLPVGLPVGYAAWCNEYILGKILERSCTASDTEAERYLKEVAQIADLGLDLLMWWRDIGSIKYPNLSRMARQFLGCPATSAGVERLFSKAGRAYNCLAKSQQEGTLEARMFIGINIDRVDLLDGHKLDSDSN